MAVFLAGNHDTALEVFDSLEQVINQNDENKDQLKPAEMNELYLFKAHILETQGEYKKAIKFMTKKTYDKAICDEIRKNETLARLYMNNN